MLKSSLLFKKHTNIQTKNAKFSEHYFYLNTNMCGNFQICISVPLTIFAKGSVLDVRQVSTYASDQHDLLNSNVH